MNVSKNLNERQMQQLHDLIQTNISAFSINGQIGKTSIVEHDIELVDQAKPHVELVRRRPPLHTTETSRQIKEMLEQGIVERCESSWASAYVVVRKKSGDSRICIDFRKLNEVTKKSSYRLPNIEDCLEPLIGNCYFSQLNLASGFCQIPLSERDKPLTSFRTEDEQFQFRRMSFGL